jgi:molybdopterin-synthase adenylyltransferase
MSTDERFHRSILLFGAQGQARLGATKTVIAGAGGLGSPLAQQLALLGVQKITHFDPEELDESNRNRFVGARHSDPVPGSPKVQLVHRLIAEINPDVMSVPMQVDLLSEDAFAAVKEADWVFGCFDDDGPRLVLSELCAAYQKPYIDLASDVPEPGVYGGRVFVSMGGQGCLCCMGNLDQADVRRFLMSADQRREHDRVYGISREALDRRGPSVAPINGVIASLAAMEFMVAVTGMREPYIEQTYRGELGVVRRSKDVPPLDCLICKSVWGIGADADVERYLKVKR